MKASKTTGKIEKQFVVDENGKKSTVIVPIEKYKELLEDIHDLAIVAERRKEYTVSFNKLKKKLKKNEIL
jgi:PHD/YefM family antitoxin component YafN of YafNO toxin-antitoxin module